jgi:LPXTG-site transpeptidase (sortase) family protein
MLTVPDPAANKHDGDYLPRKRALALIARAMRACGYSLLVACTLVYAEGEVGRRVDLAALESGPDPASWSAERIEAYSAATQAVIDGPVGLLEISSVGIRVPVYADTQEVHLNRGAGVIEGTSPPGVGGNLGIAGHRDGYFRALRGLKVGDVAVIRARGARFEYRIDSIDVVPKEDTSALVDTADPSMTLVTCFPFYFVGHAPQRFVARASLQRSLVDSGLSSHSTEDPS